MRTCKRCTTSKPESKFSRWTWCDGCLSAWETQRSSAEYLAKVHEHFDAKIAKTSSCWNWTGAKSGRGYGVINVLGRVTYAHRISYERWVGPIPDRHDIDHLCRNHACVNPTHLEAVTRRENVRRGEQGILKTRCRRGHPWTPENIYTSPGNGHRTCRICMAERRKARRATRPHNGASPGVMALRR
jgi:hypothetical protein